MSFLKGITPRGYLVMVLASFGALLFGFDNGWWGTVLGEQTSCNLSTSQQSAGSGVQSAGVSEYKAK
jgi:SP family sugar:H+ symporter-like MFS transporter